MNLESKSNMITNDSDQQISSKQSIGFHRKDKFKCFKTWYGFMDEFKILLSATDNKEFGRVPNALLLDRGGGTCVLY